VNLHGFWVQEGAEGAGFLTPSPYNNNTGSTRSSRESLPLLPPRAPYLQQSLVQLADKSEAAIHAVLEVCRTFPGSRVIH